MKGLTYWIVPGMMSLKVFGFDNDDRRDEGYIGHIEYIVCKMLRLSVFLVRGHDRQRELVIARQFIFYLSREHTSITLEKIGERFSRHHATIMHNLRQFQNLLDTEKETRITLQRLETKII